MLNRLKDNSLPTVILTCCFAMLLALPGQADSLQREGFPVIDGVTLIGVEDGKLKYRTAAGDRELALTELASLSITSVPELKVGLDALKAGELRAAQRAFENVWSGSRVQWIRHLAGFYLTQVYDQRGEAVDAAAIYSKLAADNADLFFLSKAPVASLAEADDNQKKRIGEQIMSVVKASKGEHRRLLRAYHRQVVGEDAPLPEIDDAAGRKTVEANDTKAKSKVILPQGVWEMHEKPNQPEGKWDAIGLLAAGDAAKALEAIKPWLSNPGDLPEKLFIRGKAQLMLADAAKDDKALYQDAGLTFMRIVIHFQRNNTVHPLVTPARLEVAYIHRQIGREDIYDRLLEQVFLSIDEPKDYPEYRKRYYQIIGEEVPAVRPESQDQP